ncbi:MAG TPA: heat-inducible transcription repressor HrcA [Candidatus Desulfofervidus auxilii]|uniref:Heat-inducible transcription repressor HrcA n=1 Tax=Desulfofervidus auxilii TaxID=1621989 RepID=A0A7C0Y3Q5_DESA2|nr:heat-inducible transcriptional repressor HrcA [Candidatus Desulfofervidus auxilii]HDD43678.1 heat-inducible transcription repressor HrcA [Candidatus Desulfofervidus auxilii]
MVSLILSERAKQVLGAVVNMYIQTGEPVGSRVIWKRYRLPMSPATIRNIMADLEEMGLFYQPYTSAGRVPTEKGWRFYIDTLLEKRPLSQECRLKIRQSLQEATYDLEKVLTESSRLLSSYSQQTGIVAAPKFSRIILKYIEFVKLNENAILAIIVGATGVVYHRIISAPSSIRQQDLDRFANYLNTFYAGLTLGEARAKLIEEMKKDKEKFDVIWKRVIQLSQRVLQPEKEKIYIEGTANILKYPEFTDVEVMKTLLAAFEEKSLIARLLERVMQGAKLQVFVGSEIASKELKDCSIVASPYWSGETVMGTVAVIGPMRMDYSIVIPLVEYMAQVLSEVLAQTQ